MGGGPYRGGAEPIPYPRVTDVDSIGEPRTALSTLTNALLLNLVGANGRYLRVDPEGFAFRVGRATIPQDAGPSGPAERARLAAAVRGRLAFIGGILPEGVRGLDEVPPEGRGWISLVVASEGEDPLAVRAQVFHVILRPVGGVVIHQGVEPEPPLPAVRELHAQIQAAERRCHETGELGRARSALREAVAAAAALGDSGAEARSDAHLALARLAQIKGDALEASTELERAAEALVDRPRKAKWRAALVVARGEVLATAGALAPAIEATREGHRMLVDAVGEDEPDTVLALDQLAALLEQTAHPDSADTRQTVRTLAAETFGRHDPLA